MVGPEMQVTDLSESGCFVAAGVTVRVGTPVTLFVTVSRTEIPVVGHVVRVQKGRGFAVEVNEQWRKRLKDLLDVAIDADLQ
jgi:predicted proteasome-type protease